MTSYQLNGFFNKYCLCHVLYHGICLQDWCGVCQMYLVSTIAAIEISLTSSSHVLCHSYAQNAMLWLCGRIGTYHGTGKFIVSLALVKSKNVKLSLCWSIMSCF